MARDRFGSIFFHVLQAIVDMGEMLRYPLTPFPLSLCHLDGTMQNTPQFKLLLELENCINSSSLGTIDVRTANGIFFLHLFVDLPLSFSPLAKFILQQVCKLKSTEIHLVFDKAISPSIKDSKRNKGDDNRHVAYQINGAEQKRPSNWLQSLHVDQFKEALVEFLITFWERNEFGFIIGSNIFLISGDACCSFCNEDGLIVKRTEEEKRCSHEEADSRMLFHRSKCSNTSNIII